MDVASTAGRIHAELQRAVAVSLSPMDAYIAVMMDAFKAQLNRNTTR